MSANNQHPKLSPTPTVKNHEPQQLQTQGVRCIAPDMHPSLSHIRSHDSRIKTVAGIKYEMLITVTPANPWTNAENMEPNQLRTISDLRRLN